MAIPPPDSNPRRTHVEVKEPEIDIRHLADYMGASRQSQRGVVRDCKYRRIARVVQHTEARTVIYSYILSGADDPQILLDRAQSIRDKLVDDLFDAEVNDHNADYVERFYSVYDEVKLLKADISPRRQIQEIDVNGVSLRFGHHLFLRRTTKTNKQRIGAIMLRYAKGEVLSPKIANWQTSGIFGFLRSIQEGDTAEAERNLCLVLDAYTGMIHSAPGNAIYRFNEMKAACADIAERWPAIAPPSNAIL
jgi:hypothetical protein